VNKEIKNTEIPNDEKSLENVAKFNWLKIFKVFLFRVPLWLVAVLVLVSGSWYGYSEITREEPVNLRPAITNATNVKIVISTCNKQIDKQGFNIREEEKRIEKKLQDVEGVRKSTVLIERDQENCNEE